MNAQPIGIFYKIFRQAKRVSVRLIAAVGPSRGASASKAARRIMKKPLMGSLSRVPMNGNMHGEPS